MAQATGAAPRMLDVPGALLPNLFYLRSLEDATRLQTAIDKAKREGRTHAKGRGRVAVIGAGFLGVELAASITQLGLAVDLLCAHEHPWHRNKQLPIEIAALALPRGRWRKFRSHVTRPIDVKRT